MGLEARESREQEGDVGEKVKHTMEKKVEKNCEKV